MRIKIPTNIFVKTEVDFKFYIEKKKKRLRVGRTLLEKRSMIGPLLSDIKTANYLIIKMVCNQCRDR